MRILLLIFANILLGIGVIFGYSNLFDTSLLIALQAITSFSEGVQYLHLSITSLLANDPGIVFGFLFCFGVVVYDIKYVWGWWSSFSFTKEKKCTRCSQKMYREQRQMLDHILSFMISVKRYRCVGCGKEHLITKRNSEKLVNDIPGVVKVATKK